MSTTALVWLRRDLRLYDHHALYEALKNADQVVIAYVFDQTELKDRPKQDRRVEFIWEALKELKTKLRQYHTDVVVRHGDPLAEIPALVEQFAINAVYCNREYEPKTIARDGYIAASMKEKGVQFNTYKDHLIFEQDEILSQNGKMYNVLSSYKRTWLAQLSEKTLAAYPVHKFIKQLKPLKSQYFPSLKELGFAKSNLTQLKLPLGSSGGAKLFDDFKRRINDYKQKRDLPAEKGVSQLSAHIRYGTVSIRELVTFAHEQGSTGAESWLAELIWREFYSQILWHRPDVAEHAFKPELDTLPYPNHPELFAAWCAGETGYPLVDAAMRQLVQTGYMHPRLRMIAASFLVKDLLIDWRKGEQFFAQHLLDYDLASNNGGWQWAASTGADSLPYKRIFDPVLQSEKFDGEGRFIRRYVPELAELPSQAIHAPWAFSANDRRGALFVSFLEGTDYFPPIVDHAEQRAAALALYGASGDEDGED